MKRLSWAIAGLILAGCATTASSPSSAQKTKKQQVSNTSTAPKANAVVSTEDTAVNKKICLVILNANSGKVEHSINPVNCHDQLAPVATFNVPLAIMAYDAKVISDQDSFKKWNGQKYLVDGWNKDQNAQSWLNNSALWYSQLLTWQIGQDKFKRYLKVFDYGNQDITGGLDTSWLSPAPYISQNYGFSLKISAMQQAEFYKNLLQNKLAINDDAQQFAKRLIYLQTTPNGYSLSGKSGSGFTDARYKRRIGWFVGTVTKFDQQYVIVSNFIDTADRPTGESGDRFAKQLAVEQLQAYKLW